VKWYRGNLALEVFDPTFFNSTIKFAYKTRSSWSARHADCKCIFQRPTARLQRQRPKNSATELKLGATARNFGAIFANKIRWSAHETGFSFSVWARLASAMAALASALAFEASIHVLRAQKSFGAPKPAAETAVGGIPSDGYWPNNRILSRISQPSALRVLRVGAVPGTWLVSRSCMGNLSLRRPRHGKR